MYKFGMFGNFPLRVVEGESSATSTYPRPWTCFNSLSLRLRGVSRVTWNLHRHRKEHQHQPYACECGSLFSRQDVLDRHLDGFSTDAPRYPCIFCRRAQFYFTDPIDVSLFPPSFDESSSCRKRHRTGVKSPLQAEKDCGN